MLAVAGAAVVGCSRGTRSSSTTTTVPGRARLSESEVRDLDIEFYEQRADRDPTGATDLARLAGSICNGRARPATRATPSAPKPPRGDPFAIAIRATTPPRRCFRRASSRSTGSTTLSRSRERCATATPTFPRSAPPSARSEMELGQYDSARVTFDSLGGFAQDLSVAPRLARWAEIEGRTGEARWLMRTALKTALATPHLPREQVAWFWLRNGDLDLRTGKLRAGGFRVPRRARRRIPATTASRRDGEARRRAARWRAAIAAGEQAIATSLDPGDARRGERRVCRDRRQREVATSTRGRWTSPSSSSRARTTAPGASSCSTIVATSPPCIARCSSSCARAATSTGTTLLAWALHAQGRDVEAKARDDPCAGAGNARRAALLPCRGDRARARRQTAASELFARARTLQPAASTAASEAQ